MPSNDLQKFVAELNLAPSDYSYEGLATRSFLEAVEDPNKEAAFVNDKSLVSFAAGVSIQNRADLLNSLLLAQLAANRQFSSEDDLKKWYDAFFKLMNKLGWLIETSKTTEYIAKGTVVEIESVVLEILQSALGGKVIEVAKSLINAFKSLTDEKKKKFIAFEKNTHSLKKGCFLFGVADEQNNALSVSFCFILLSSTHEIKQILFFRSQKDESRLETATFKGTLNITIYDKIRKTVIEKLEDNAEKFIAEIEI